MAKSITADLLSDIESTVTTLALCVEIVRKDGKTIRMTTHESDLTVESVVYRHDLPFTLSSISSATDLSVDNTEMSLFCDEVVFKLADFKNNLYEYAAVNIFLVNYTNTARGAMTMRKGWFGPLDYAENKIIKVTVTGLLKTLDLKVGRIVQPSCDADLGDSRCKIALQQGQMWSELNTYHVGDWVYYYDPALMTAITVVNPSFETDGAVGSGGTITGWTKAPGAKFEVKAGAGGLGSFSPIDGSFMLTGTTLTALPTESAIYQDIDLATEIGSTSDIDDGKITILLSAAFLASFNLKNVSRLKIDIKNADGDIIDSGDTRYIKLDTLEAWRERGIVMPLVPTARTCRVWIYSLVQFSPPALVGANAADRVRMYWWDHTTTSPHSDVIYKASRIGGFGTLGTFYLSNSSFDLPGLVSNADNPTITSWTTGSGNWWQIVATAFAGALLPQNGLRFLLGGDDGGVVSNLYEIVSANRALTTGAGWNLPADRIALGKIAGQFRIYVGYGDTDSKATVIIDWLDTLLNVVDTVTVVNDVAGTVGFHEITEDIIVPGDAAHVRVTLKARSPTGDGAANVAFDGISFSLFDTGRPLTSDTQEGQGDAATVFNAATGEVTFDGNITWKAISALIGYDEVSSVVNDRYEFVGTGITGVAGTYETGLIRWLSGANAGLRNVVRKFTPSTRTLKVYFKTPYPIEAGDRFFFQQACQRRFIEDCVLRFDNAINFRGFPYVPGQIPDVFAAGNAGAGLTETGVMSPPSGAAAGGYPIKFLVPSNVLGATQFQQAVIFGVRIGGNVCTSISRLGYTVPDASGGYRVLEITVIAPAHAAGTVNVEVSPGPGTWTVVGTFDYV